MNDRDRVVKEMEKQIAEKAQQEFFPYNNIFPKHPSEEMVDQIVAEKKTDLFDDVKKPKHYNIGNIETIEIIKEITQHYTGFQAYLVGNVVKYLPRAPHKGKKLEDLQKAYDYLGRLIEEVKNEETTL